MKAIRINQPGEVELVHIPEPAAPGPDEVLLRIRQVGFCGSDLTTFRGLNPMVSYPRIPGHEIGASIEALGPGVPEHWKPGDRVIVSPYSHCGTCSACRQGRFNTCRFNQTLGVQRDGFMTGFAVIPHQKLFSSNLLDFPEMALVEPLTVGFHAAARGEVTHRDTVAVFGCGAIGLGAIAGASARGARVIAIDIDDGKLALARRCGAAETIHAKAEPLREQLRNMTHGEGPDVMIEAVGSPETFRTCVEEVCFAGRVVYVGYAKLPVEYETRFFVMKELDIRGSRNALPEDFAAVIAHLESGAFPSRELISRTVSIEEAPAALRAWDKDPGSVTRIHVRL